MKELHYKSLRNILLAAILVLTGHLSAWGEIFSLDKESVFCIFYKMSEGDVREEDLEELSVSLGRPTFTLYKPDEMFARKSLTRLNARLMERMRQMDTEALFRWRLKGPTALATEEESEYSWQLNPDDLPHPTPYIRSEVSRNDLYLVQRELARLVPRMMRRVSGSRTGGPWDIHVYLKPGKIEYRFDTRRIAREEVFLPHRFVVFRPVGLEVTPPGNSPQILTFRREP